MFPKSSWMKVKNSSCPYRVRQKSEIFMMCRTRCAWSVSKVSVIKIHSTLYTLQTKLNGSAPSNHPFNIYTTLIILPEKLPTSALFRNSRCLTRPIIHTHAHTVYRLSGSALIGRRRPKKGGPIYDSLAGMGVASSASLCEMYSQL